jgi:hypothetical protein
LSGVCGRVLWLLDGADSLEQDLITSEKSSSKHDNKQQTTTINNNSSNNNSTSNDNSGVVVENDQHCNVSDLLASLESSNEDDILKNRIITVGEHLSKTTVHADL